jgi:hypothetical protein
MIRWIDITDDVSKKYYNAFIQQVAMPEYVKSANIPTKDDAAVKNSECFADSVNKKFALDSKSDCWCSALYFYGNQCNTLAIGKQAEVKLLNAARVWGISEDIKSLKSAFEQQTIPASYAITFDHKGVKIERCPDHTKEAATASAEWLYENRFKFPVKVQKKAAAKLQAKANVFKLGVKTASYIDKLANSDTYSNLNCKIAIAITDRLSGISTIKWSELEDELLKVANDLNTRPFELCQNGDIIVNCLEALDVKHGLNSKWGSAVHHPIDVCFRVNLTKAASAADGVVHLTTGTPVDLTKISDHQLEKGLKIAGDDFFHYCQTDGLNIDRSKAAEIIPTMPKPEAMRFELAIKTAGYIPETTYGLADRIFKEGNAMMGYGAMPASQETTGSDMAPNEDDASFEARMHEKKEQAKIDSLDAQAGLAAVKARKARHQYEQSIANNYVKEKYD